MKNARVIFTGHFAEYFVYALGLMVLSVLTLGIMLPYLFYWSFKYFFTRLEIEFYDDGNYNKTIR